MREATMVKILRDHHCHHDYTVKFWCVLALTSIYIFPWTSDNALFGRPLRRCRPSQFWETTCLSTPALYNCQRAMWVSVGSACVRSWRLKRNTKLRLLMQSYRFREATAKYKRQQNNINWWCDVRSASKIPWLNLVARYDVAHEIKLSKWYNSQPIQTLTLL